MRYYSTQKRGQVTIEDEFTIADTDPRVKNFFEPTPGGYVKAYTDDGLPFNELIPVADQGELDSNELDFELSSKLEKIDKKAQEKIELGFDSSSLGIAHKYDCRKGIDSSDLLMAIEIAIGSSSSQPYMAQALGQHFVDTMHTLTELRQVAEDMRDHVQSHRIIARNKKSAATNARNSNDLAAIQAVDVTDWV